MRIEYVGDTGFVYDRDGMSLFHAVDAPMSACIQTSCVCVFVRRRRRVAFMCVGNKMMRHVFRAI